MHLSAYFVMTAHSRSRLRFACRDGMREQETEPNEVDIDDGSEEPRQLTRLDPRGNQKPVLAFGVVTKNGGPFRMGVLALEVLRREDRDRSLAPLRASSILVTKL